MSHISLRHVHKAYQKKTMVIKDVSLEIFDGEFLVFVGPSGSGKTTMLRMISGLEEITEGELWINGSFQNDQDPSTRHLSFVFQNYALLPHLTVEENIQFGLINQKLSRIEEKKRVEEVANKLHVTEKLGSYPHQLSGGQRQRVALARALVDNEPLILFDEPLSNLDALLRTGMRTELMRLQKEMSITSLYVTHDQIEAMAMADRLVLMMDGKIIQVGTPLQMYQDPIHLDVIQFIGSPEANIINVTYENQRLLIHDYNINIPKDLIQAIEQSQRQPKYLAIRPQDMKIVKDSGLPGRLIFKEHMGSKELLHVDVYGQTFKIMVNPNEVILENLMIGWNESIYVFDQDKRRIKSNINPNIHVNRIPHHPVIQELINYGYTWIIDEKHPTVFFHKTDHHVDLYQHDGIITLKREYDLLTYYPYIK
ncbi:MAG TPA: ABC transporter ATP-binding protein [Acholeplasmataceae bacterium]|nr:ABC transporter ATP-binding protein [Acholeplasmataceae bacterium]